MTTWKYSDQDWLCWENLHLYKFTKQDFTSQKKTLTNVSFLELFKQNPLSWAMTSGANIEYTLEAPDKLLVGNRTK